MIPGLSHLPDFITGAEEAALLDSVDAQPWLSDLKRRVQHYGYRYDYKARAVTQDLYLGPLPDWLADYAARLHRNGTFPTVPDQVIVNEYQPGQGIAPHIDCVPCFAETITSLSLGSPCVMNFARSDTGQKTSLLLEPRSLLILSGEARYRWTHAIAARKSDKWNGAFFARGRRVSLTFRKVLAGA
ncbi:MAG: alpha-ketoglutarate-dependent dioxygenase AlkB [Alphaproteobacteria bacterium]